jgi:hypothetical protein
MRLPALATPLGSSRPLCAPDGWGMTKGVHWRALPAGGGIGRAREGCGKTNQLPGGVRNGTPESTPFRRNTPFSMLSWVGYSLRAREGWLWGKCGKMRASGSILTLDWCFAARRPQLAPDTFFGYQSAKGRVAGPPARQDRRQGRQQARASGNQPSAG